MPLSGTTFDENVGAALRAAIGRLNREPKIAAGDSGSHFPVPFSKEKPMSNRQKIEGTIHALYGSVFNAGKADLLPGLIAGPFIQHNPLFPNGPEPLMGYLKQAGSIPCEIKRMAIDGNLAFIHVRYLNWAGKEHAAVDIFRFNEDGKIVEHWDVLQPVPDTASNNNTMF